MTRDDKKRRAGSDPLGELRLGFEGLLSGLGDAISEISDRLEAGQSGEFRKSFDVETGQGPVRAEAGLRVRFADSGPFPTTGSDVQMDRPVNPERKRRSSPAPIEPSPPARPIDFVIIEDDEVWRLSADIPGVEFGEVSLRMGGDELIIETTGARRFTGVTSLPEGLTLGDLEMTLRNGILELSGARGRAGEE